MTVCLYLPLYSEDSGSEATLLEVNGAGVLGPLVLFALLATGAWLGPSRRMRVILAGGHALLTMLALLSIGVLFLPASILLVLGAAAELRQPVPERHHRPLVAAE